MILVVDNYDSFTHNIARYLAMAGAAVEVARNDALTTDDVGALAPEAIVISPGPRTPTEAGVSNAIIARFSGHVPILGVCLGHQCLGALHGGRIAHAAVPMHGLPSLVSHGGVRLFAGLPSPLPVGRYHSLIVEETPEMTRALSVDARSAEGEIMALSHRTHPTWSVQFHPESILTPSGDKLFANFLAMASAFMRDRARPHVLA